MRKKVCAVSEPVLSVLPACRRHTPITNAAGMRCVLSLLTDKVSHFIFFILVALPAYRVAKTWLSESILFASRAIMSLYALHY